MPDKKPKKPEVKKESKPLAVNAFAKDRATTADSLAIYNNAKQVATYYNGKNYQKGSIEVSTGKGTQKEPTKIRDNRDVTRTNQGAYDYFFSPNRKPIALVPTSDGKQGVKYLPKNLYRRDVNENQYYQRETADGILDTRATMTLFDKRITPQTQQTYTNTNANDPMYGDIVSLFEYDPIAVKPYNMLTPAEKIIRDRKYPQKQQPNGTNTPNSKGQQLVKDIQPIERKDYPIRGPLPKAQTKIQIESPQQEIMPIQAQQPTNWSFTYPGEQGVNQQQYFNSQAEYDAALKQVGGGQPIGNQNYMGSKQEGNVYSSQFKTKPNMKAGGTIAKHAHSMPKDAMVHDKKLTAKQKKFFSDMCDASNMKRAAWGASLGTDQFSGGPDPINPYPQGFNATLPQIDAQGNPIPPPTMPYKGTIPGDSLPTNSAWDNPAPIPGQTTPPAPPQSPNRASYQKMDPNQTGTAAPNVGEGNLNRGQTPNLTPGQQQYDKQAVNPAYKGKDFKAPQSTGLQGSGGQFVLTGLMLADAVMKKEKIRRRYVRPEDMETYNPNAYGTGSTALMENGGSLGYVKNMEYDLPEEEIKKLLKQGYKLKYL